MENLINIVSNNINSIFVAVLLFSLFLTLKISKSKRLLKNNERRLKDLQDHLHIKDIEQIEDIFLQRAVLIEIDNPLDVARKKSNLAKFIDKLAPNLVKAKVYKQVAQEARQDLIDKKVKGQVKVITI